MRPVSEMFMSDPERGEEQVEGLHGDRPALMTHVVPGASLRTRATWLDRAGVSDNAGQLSLRLVLYGGTDSTLDVGFEQRHPPHGDVREFVYSGQWSLEGDGARRLQAAGESQAGSRLSSSPLRPSIAPHQQHTPWRQPMRHVDLARVTAGNSDNRATPTASVLVDRRPSEKLLMVPLTSSAAMDSSDAAALGHSTSGGTGGASGYGSVQSDRGHRIASSNGQCRDDTCSLPSTIAPLRGGGCGGVPASLPTTVDRGAVVVDAPTSPLGVRHPTRRSHGPSSSAAAEVAGATPNLSPPPSWDLESGRGSTGRATAGQAGGCLVSLGLERSQGSSTGDSGAGTYTGLHHGRGFFHVGGQQRGSPPRDRHQPHQSPRPQDCQRQLGRRSQQRSALPFVDTIVAPTWSGRGGSDPGTFGTALPALRSSYVADAVRRPYPLPGLAEAEASVGALQVRVGGRDVGFGEPAADADGVAGGAVRADAADGSADAGPDKGEQRTRANDYCAQGQSGPMSTRLSMAAGCAGAGCEGRPRFVFKGSKRLTYYAGHRTVGMVDPRHPQCQDERCTRQPSFGMEGDRRASYCVTHKEAGMINVLARRCQQTRWSRHPTFGFPGDRRSSFCKRHRETGMVDIVSRQCQDSPCTRRPLYNMRGLRPVWCSRHKLPGMIDDVSVRCQAPGCSRHPSFGYASDKKTRRCARHRLEDMERVKGRRQEQRREVPTDDAAGAGAGADADADADAAANRSSHPASHVPTLSSPLRSNPLADDIVDSGAVLPANATAASFRLRGRPVETSVTCCALYVPRPQSLVVSEVLGYCESVV